jgi:predicted 3-demethylubiquinone-9 3-methyltransferase (glyoxalase superfamily)
VPIQPCGWLKDKFGVSWKAMATVLKMKKLDVAAIRPAAPRP